MAQQKIALVTGASSGIGKATARKLLQDGLTVYGAARRVEKMQYLEELGGTVLKMDITVEEEVKAAVDQIIEEQGRIDILVNNAGYAIYGAVEDTEIEEAREQFEVNLFGLAQITKLVLPHMRKERSGKIINVSSMGGKIYTLLGAWYHASKHALEGWSDCLRLEVAPFGIDVIIIEPGIIETEFGDVMTSPMMDRSGNSAYADLAKRVAKTTKKSYEDGSPPSVIAETISEAVADASPKTRYAKGSMAKLLLFLRWLFNDKLFDKLLMSQT